MSQGADADAIDAGFGNGSNRFQVDASRCFQLNVWGQLIAALYCGAKPIELIRQLRPSVLVKGGDYRKETVVGHELVEADGGEVVLIDLVPGHSTTAIVKKSGRPAIEREVTKTPTAVP